MSNFLRRWTKQVPAPATPALENRREAFDHAVAAFRKASDDNETLRAIRCRCAVAGKPFTVVFERISPSHRFQIARIEREDGAGPERKTGGGLFARKPAQKSYDAGEFDWAGYACPYCGDRSGVVHCSACRETVCAGRVRPLPDGSRAFACHDRCGATGVTEPSTQIHGGAADNPGLARGEPATRLALPNAATKRLRGPRQK